MKKEDFQHVNYAWDNVHAGSLDPVERLVYRSNLLGSDQRITNTGGGNTSSKLMEEDPISQEQVEVLWIKGSGGDLRTVERDGFASLRQRDLVSLQRHYRAAPEQGPKTPIEDKMVSMYRHCTFRFNPRAASIDTALHSFVDRVHVDHTHPHACIAVAASRGQESLTREIYGDQVKWVPWKRPGFDLGLDMQRACENSPDCEGVILGQHGLINWANGDRECYELSLSLIEKAARYIEAHDRGEQTFGGQKYHPLDEGERRAVLMEVLPWLRGRIGGEKRVIATKQTDLKLQRFVNSYDAERLAEMGTSCPDHFLRTKLKPLYVDWNPQEDNVEVLLAKLAAGLERYRQDYAAYYDAHERPDSPPMRDPNPTVILIPGVGMVAFGRNKSESRVTAEFYNSAVEVMRGAEAIGSYQALPQQEAFDIEYWSLEEAKLRRMPPEKEFERSVVVVVGAGSGIGKAAAYRMAEEGAHVVCADLSGEAARETAEQITALHGHGIGIAGTGLSNCGRAIGLQVDVADRSSVETLFEDVVMSYGGVDTVIVTAGLFVAPDHAGRIADEKWSETFDINVKGLYLVADEARRIWLAQDSPGSLVLTTSGEYGPGSIAFQSTKAAANHLVRELAQEMAPLVRVNGMAPAIVVEGSEMYPRERVIRLLREGSVDFDESEETEDLRRLLARYFGEQALTGVPVTPGDCAEAAYLLASERLGCTTGQVIHVDGGKGHEG